jgi:hypothetical protein
LAQVCHTTSTLIIHSSVDGNNTKPIFGDKKTKLEISKITGSKTNHNLYIVLENTK